MTPSPTVHIAEVKLFRKIIQSLLVVALNQKIFCLHEHMGESVQLLANKLVANQ